MSEKKKMKKSMAKNYFSILMGYILFALVFWWVSGDQLNHEVVEAKSITAKDCAAVMTDGTKVEFMFTPNTELLDEISLLIGTYGRENQGELVLQVLSDNNVQLGETKLNTLYLADYVYQKFTFDEPIKLGKQQSVKVVILAQNVPENQGVSLWYGTSIDAGRISISNTSENTFSVNDEEANGKICYSTRGRNSLWIGQWYWTIVFVGGALGTLYCIRIFWKLAKNQEVRLIQIIELLKRYSFLIRQLVSRDFKRKYKKSALGVLWSFLNPLLTMLVQYLVFSTIFKSSIENFIVYLLSGIILFNFFGEAVGLGLNSIIDNAHLINKVYMPKVIYPFSRVLSSAINLLISLVPLLLMMIITGVPMTKAMLLIPIGLLCLLVFCLGMSMLLSTAMVFFRDALFLWNIVSTLWMYLTPTFYPVDIIPEAWLPIYKLNPMYQYITFLRSILLDGVAPAPNLYVGCTLSASVVFILGWVVFRKNQDKFVLYL